MADTEAQERAIARAAAMAQAAIDTGEDCARLIREGAHPLAVLARVSAGEQQVHAIAAEPLLLATSTGAHNSD